MGDIEKRIDTALKQAVRQRNYRRVRDRALRRLGNLYPDQYRELLEEERARDEQEGKTWVDINGRANASLGASTTDKHADKDANGFSYQGEARDLAGKE